MKAIVQDAYGSADVLELREIDIPLIGDNDVLVRVHAAGLHIGDWHVMTGLPYMLRVIGFGLLAPNVRVRGMDVAGVVEKTGSAVTRFAVGDAVFGTCEGSFAGYARVPEEQLVPKPATLTFEQAAVVPTSSFAALQALRDTGGLGRGQHVLIVGAAGGVGLFAVQIAKALGAKVTAVCSTGKVDLVRSLGADRVIDYTKDDFTLGSERYDVIVNMAGGRSLGEMRRVLRDDGTLVLVGGEGGNRWVGAAGQWFNALLMSPFVRHKLRPLATKPNRKDLELVKELVDSGKLASVIDRTFALAEVPDAFRYLLTGKARGKVVITVQDPS
jgi:NADPH:quinone reductase-like Zn-dependent oxidoreductase